jgi:hypothetical protein
MAFLMSAVQLILLLACASLTAHAAIQGYFDRTLNVSGPVDLNVQSGSGGIVVRPGDSAKVEIYGKIYASGWLSGGDIENLVHYLESHPPIEQNGNTIRIGHIEDRDLTRNISISYEVIVPAQTKLHSSSGSGGERIEGIRGPVEVSSGSGGITLSNIGADSSAHTGSGGIDIDSVHGNVRAGTGSGSIHATGIAGGFTASTGSGEVHLEQIAAGGVDIGTGSGSVAIKGADGEVHVQTGSGSIVAQGQPKGDWRLHTASGSLNVTFPATAAYELVARTSSGSIYTSQEMTVQGAIGRHELHGKVHGGGSVVDLSTSSGSIRID